jgi:hypothetical protein
MKYFFFYDSIQRPESVKCVGLFTGLKILISIKINKFKLKNDQVKDTTLIKNNSK